MMVSLRDGPMAGHSLVVSASAGSHLVLPQVDGDGAHFISHHYSIDGTWRHSETFVGYESDESIAESKALWDEMYWDALETDAERSYV